MNGELFRLSIRRVLRRKGSSLLLFSVLFLSFAFSLISLTVTGSMQETNQEYIFDTYGTWYGAIPSGWEQDEAFLRKQVWLDRLGVCKSYGEPLEGAGIGTVDETFLQIGRIGLQDGRFPREADEVAMEADLLSALGYDYTLGQEITLSVSVPAGDVRVTVARRYTLCGVIREYTDLWMRPANTLARRLNSAVITEDAAAALWLEAEKTAAQTLVETETGETYTPTLDPVAPQYHFTVLPGYEGAMKEQVDEYLENTGHPDNKVSINTAAYAVTASGQSYDTFYAVIILTVTMLSIVCIYAVRIRDEARQLATFRSIGITKRQLCVMLFYETLCLAVPAIILGVGAAWLGTLALLRLAVFSGSVEIQFSLPVLLLVTAAALWFLGVLTARLAVFLVALRTPLTGRFHIARKKAKRYQTLQRVLIAGLSSLLCAAVIFTVMESLESFYNIRRIGSYEDYTVSKKRVPESNQLV